MSGRTSRVDPDTALSMAAAYRTGAATLEDLAKPHGLTRERVRQIIKEVDPAARDEARIARLLRQVKEAERRRDEREVERRKADEDALRRGVRCRLCWGPNGRAVTGRRYVTCSSRCARLWTLLRYQLDEAQKEQHKRSMARWTIANPSHPFVNDARLRYAARVLAGEELEWRPDFEPFSEAVRKGLAEVKQLRDHWALAEVAS